MFNLNFNFFDFNIKTLDNVSIVQWLANFNLFIIYLLFLNIIFFFFLNIIFFFFFKNFFFNFFKKINIINITFIVIVSCIKLLFTWKFEKISGIYCDTLKTEFYNSNLNNLPEFISIFSNSLADILLILGFFTSAFCLIFLGTKNFFKNISNFIIFYIFNFFVLCLTSTNNLLLLFISFEFLFLPTMLFAYKFNYLKKSIKSIDFFFKWTFFGSFLVFCSICYLYFVYNTLNYNILVLNNFSSLEIRLIFCSFLIGFGVKIPLVPFHYWLIRVHVDSPTGFSMFLSGFLVKTALYCLIMFISIFNRSNIIVILYIWVIFSLLLSTFGLSFITDIKKLIAWATVQEMTFITLFVISKSYIFMTVSVIFVLLHGLLSIYMFYISDIIYKRFKTRSIHYVSGLHILMPSLTKFIWFSIILFNGFPLTVKYYIEWHFITLTLNSNHYYFILFIVIINFLSGVFFSKNMLQILYGTPNILDDSNLDIEFQQFTTFFFLTKNEKVILYTLMFFIFFLNFIIYLI